MNYREQFEQANPDCQTWDQVDYWLNYAHFIESSINDRDELIKEHESYISYLQSEIYRSGKYLHEIADGYNSLEWQRTKGHNEIVKDLKSKSNE